MILLDRNILIELERGNKKLILILEELSQKHPTPSLPFPVFSEYYYGYLKKGRKDVQTALERLDEFEILNSTRKSALLFSDIKYNLEKTGQIISDMDMLIASICIDNNATLITFDKQFEKIKELDKILVEF